MIREGDPSNVPPENQEVPLIAERDQAQDMSPSIGAVALELVGRQRYLTDGVRLYEIADQRTVQNFGLRKGTISYTIIRDCESEAVARIDDLMLLALTEVKPQPKAA